MIEFLLTAIEPDTAFAVESAVLAVALAVAFCQPWERASAGRATPSEPR